ncbi:uncharacterized protein TNCV_3952131 [Trichonephila clavipes]|uniref:Peptidase aspartic putative domain-containing protein n=1 Tax=Trichonephila clavipes TaxID=2585209 RepID=A0A8X6V9X7_TRICX|nr:uncharacterized protein TNCV_3952131 [Trichonephila clavipes]
MVELADDRFNIPDKIDMLLGAEIFFELLRPEKFKIKNSDLILQNTVFGYVVSGNVDSLNETKVHCGLVRDEDLNKTLQKFWEVENVEIEQTKNNEANLCEEHFMKMHSRNIEGRYVVKMPLKCDPNCSGSSRGIAPKLLNALWIRLERDPQYLKLYREFMQEYIQLGHMREVTVENDNPKMNYFLPHHGVYRPEKSTTKVRVVFNTSSPTDNGLSLNDILLNGGVIQDNLYAQMIRFRTF